jgi:hypothetical protein
VRNSRITLLKMKLNFGFATPANVAFACVWLPQSWNPDDDAEAEFLQGGS